MGLREAHGFSVPVYAAAGQAQGSAPWARTTRCRPTDGNKALHRLRRTPVNGPALARRLRWSRPTGGQVRKDRPRRPSPGRAGRWSASRVQVSAIRMKAERSSSVAADKAKRIASSARLRRSSRSRTLSGAMRDTYAAPVTAASTAVVSHLLIGDRLSETAVGRPLFTAHAQARSATPVLSGPGPEWLVRESRC